MSKMTEFYDTTFNEILKFEGGDAHIAGAQAKCALVEREQNLYDTETELEDFSNYIRERYKKIIAKPFITPFGHCVMLVEKSMVREYSDWLKTRGFDEQL